MPMDGFLATSLLASCGFLRLVAGGSFRWRRQHVDFSNIFVVASLSFCYEADDAP